MKTTYATTILGFGKHASIEIPDDVLRAIGGNKRAPLKVTIKGYTYQSTATVMDGMCMVVFPMRDRLQAGVDSGDTVEVTLELDAGYRVVEIPDELDQALRGASLSEVFDKQIYSKRKEFARQVAEAKALVTKTRRIDKIIGELSHE
ncbi:MAG: YdeI/OmpD-associated family protein [Candidatus Saccharimonadales bacterium]